LDLKDANCTVWTRAFSAIFSQYGLYNHIDGSTTPGDSDWVQNDCTIVSWLYNRIAPGSPCLRPTNEDSAYSLWQGGHEIFHVNKNSRAV
jgi:hypothetical protein